MPDVRDAFELDPSKWADKDGDWIDDNMDADDDGDGFRDQEKMKHSTNPLNKLNFPV